MKRPIPLYVSRFAIWLTEDIFIGYGTYGEGKYYHVNQNPKHDTGWVYRDATEDEINLYKLYVKLNKI